MISPTGLDALRALVNELESSSWHPIKEPLPWQTAIKLRAIIAAEERAKVGDEPIVREFLWLNHGCSIVSLYGDDGEMQCSNGPHRPLDFKRQPLAVLVRGILAARIERAKEPTRENLIAQIETNMETIRTQSAQLAEYEAKAEVREEKKMDDNFVQSLDARDWAQAFCARFGTTTIDEGLMIGWFANAIERGRDAGHAAALTSEALVSDAAPGYRRLGRFMPASVRARLSSLTTHKQWPKRYARHLRKGAKVKTECDCHKGWISPCPVHGEAKAEAGFEQPEGMWCPECGAGVKVDEEGLCVSCGTTAIGNGANAALRALARKIGA